MRFAYVAQPRRVVFGADSVLGLPDELESLGVSRAYLVSSPGREPALRRIAELLGARCVGAFTGVTADIAEAEAEAVRTAVREAGAEGIVALGGGSALDFGKYVAIEDALPIVTVPTTYSGAELTPGFRLYRDGQKVAALDMRALPKTIVYDPLLTLDLPARLSADTGMNAMAHAVESFYGANANPVTALIAEEAIRRLAASLPVVIREPDNVAARTDALYGAFLGISSTNMAGISIHHRVSQTLGGVFHIDHGATNAIMLPQIVKFCAEAVPDALVPVARALGADSAAAALFDFAGRLGAPTALRDVGMREGDLDAAVTACLPRISHSPRPVDATSLRRILEDAYHGRRPE